MSGINDKLKTALNSQKYFITISHKNGDRLQHYWVTKNYLHDDLMPTLEHIKKEVYKKEFSTAGIEEKSGRAHE